ncbi:MAG: hypothetical protein GXZ09_08390 [Syntrophomonadaceae bacterium]|nr:hypothetical protein [Syntrophomonadaceae bacterium]
MSDENNSIFYLPKTIFGSKEWKAMEEREFSMGPDALLDELLNQKTWSNVEILWVIKRMIYFYGRKEDVLSKAPTKRLMKNLNDVLRVFYLIMDKTDPELDDNLRSYITNKLSDATWGINQRTREYLYKLE